MQTSPKRLLALSTRALALGLALALGACGGVIAFSDTSSIAVTGTPPKPPEPPKEEPPPPPKPKRVEVTADKIVIHEKIQFDLNKATIKSDSHELLGEIVDVFKENPHIKKVSIEGHTDDQGADAYNKKLSDQRAKSVLDYLVEKGIDAGRLTSKGFGETKPIATNDTPEGQEQNRRVEFIITEQEEITKTFEIDPKTGKKKEVTPEDEKDKKKADKKKKEES
jgi:outer membrane protein OmpA-like peptidoglycan-associated protein